MRFTFLYLDWVRFADGQRLFQPGDVKLSISVEYVFSDRNLAFGAEFPDDDRIAIQLRVRRVEGDVISGGNAL